MKSAALLLAALGLVALAFVVVLLIDGLRTIVRREADERRARPLALVVRAREEVGGELLRLTFTHPRRRRLPAFEAGQHLLMTAPAGPGGRVIRRAYSLAGWHPQPTQYELGIKREAHGAMSSWAWDTLLPGTVVQVSPPRGEFVLGADDGELVLIGGGIGITPMRAMLYAALARSPAGRRIMLLHAARRTDTLLYRAEFERLAEQFPQFTYLPLVSRADAAWRGERGRLDARRVLDAVSRPGSAQFYLCASTELMDTLRAGLLSARIAPAQIHWEAFGAAAAGPCGQVITLDGGRRIETAGEPSLLATLETHDCAPPAECRAGSCGQCRMRLETGEVRWLLTPACALADDEVLPCICQPAGELRIRAIA